MELGLYLPLYSNNREFLISSKRRIAKIAKTLEIFEVCILTECWIEQDRSVVSLTNEIDIEIQENSELERKSKFD